MKQLAIVATLALLVSGAAALAIAGSRDQAPPDASLAVISTVSPTPATTPTPAAPEALGEATALPTLEAPLAVRESAGSASSNARRPAAPATSTPQPLAPDVASAGAPSQASAGAAPEAPGAPATPIVAATVPAVTPTGIPARALEPARCPADAPRCPAGTVVATAAATGAASSAGSSQPCPTPFAEFKQNADGSWTYRLEAACVSREVTTGP